MSVELLTQKKNFVVDDRVCIDKTGSDLDGSFGTILGKSSEGVVDIYIVMLDRPIPTHKAATFPEYCLISV